MVHCFLYAIPDCLLKKYYEYSFSKIRVFSGVRVARSLVVCVMFCRSLFVIFTFSFGHCVVCPSLIYGIWVPLWYLLTFLFGFFSSHKYKYTIVSIARYVTCFINSLTAVQLSIIQWWFILYEHEYN
jgi:hypothetical protein